MRARGNQGLFVDPHDVSDIRTLPHCYQSFDPPSHTPLGRNLTEQITQIQMGMAIHQRRQYGAVVLAHLSHWPVAPKHSETIHGQNDSFDNHHRAIFNGWSGYGAHHLGTMYYRPRR
jgi:hypothetical protein